MSAESNFSKELAGLVKDAGERIEQLRSLDRVKLLRGDLGSFSFESAKGAIFGLINLFASLRNEDLLVLPAHALQLISSTAQTALSEFDQVVTFSEDRYRHDASSHRHQLIARIVQLHRDTFQELAPILGLVAIERTDVALKEWNDRLGIVAGEWVSAKQQFESDVQGFRKAIESLVETGQATARDVGIVKHAAHFSRQASEHKRSAHWWLLTTVIIACLASVFAVRQLWLFEDTITRNPPLINQPAFQIVAMRFIVLSIALGAAVWCGKIYRAHRHNYVVNKHRQNALSSFEAFVLSAAADSQTKNAVLLQATHCIFSPQNTGYGGHETDAPAPQILEIFRDLTGSRK